ADCTGCRPLRCQKKRQAVVAPEETEIFQSFASFGPLVPEQFLGLVQCENRTRDPRVKLVLQACSGRLIELLHRKALPDLRSFFALPENTPDQEARDDATKVR